MSNAALHCRPDLAGAALRGSYSIDMLSDLAPRVPKVRSQQDRSNAWPLRVRTYPANALQGFSRGTGGMVRTMSKGSSGEGVARHGVSANSIASMRTPGSRFANICGTP